MTDAEDWFRRRTWRVADVDVDALRARKAERGAEVSVVVPALNEAGTVAAVVAAARSAVGLVDEVVVVDGGSTDGTAARASAAGARVVRQGEVLAELPPGRGKGDALWRGLAATSGDVVVFLDADLHDADARYVTGLLAPLLEEPGVGFVKACYDRPLRVGGELFAAGGGRVTELTARPLLAAFWPQLAGLAQPLSGEYAGRREVLAAVPFVDGYGVEIGLLIDICSRFGADAIAQVDLGRRVHSHQPLHALARMASEIVAVAADRLAAEGRLHGDVGRALLQPVRDGAGRLRLEPWAVAVSQRPPLSSVAGDPTLPL